MEETIEEGGGETNGQGPDSRQARSLWLSLRGPKGGAEEPHGGGAEEGEEEEEEGRGERHCAKGAVRLRAALLARPRVSRFLRA